MAAFPAFQLTKLEWSLDKRQSSGDSYEDDSYDHDFTQSGGDVWEEDAVEVLTTIVSIEGKSQGYSSNVRQLINDFEAFIKLLDSDDRVTKVNIVALPVKVSPEAELSGNFNGTSIAESQLFESFKLELELNHAAG